METEVAIGSLGNATNEDLILDSALTESYKTND